jgi:hypothetical protein
MEEWQRSCDILRGEELICSLEQFIKPKTAQVTKCGLKLDTGLDRDKTSLMAR